jgi:hypothetical protein
MPVVRWGKVPGRTSIQPKGAVTGPGAWPSAPSRSTPSAGRPQSGAGTGIARAWRKATRPSRSSSPWPEHGGPACGPWPRRVPGHHKPPAASAVTHQCARFPPSLGSDAAPVWWNPRRREEAARSSRPSREAGPRRRPGRWEPTHGDPRDHPSGLPGSGSSERERGKSEADVKKLLPTLDIGSHSNAAPQPLPEAGLGKDKAQCLAACFLILPV